MSLADRFFTEVLGLDPDTTKKAMSTIRASGSGSQVSDSMIRRRIGPQSMTLLYKAMDASKAEAGTEARGMSDDDTDMTADEFDPNEEQFDDWGDEDKPVRESRKFCRLTDYLIAEAMVDVDLSDPAAAANEIRRTARKAQTSPERVEREQMVNAREKKKEASQEEGPTKPIKQQIARKQQELIMLNKRLRDMEKRQDAAGGAM